MKKTNFYSWTNKGAVKHDGWQDDNFQYYKGDSGTWWAIDPMCGQAVCNASSKKNCINKVYSDDIQNRYHDFIRSEKYTKMCSDWYKILVEAGIYMENMIK